MLRPALVQNIAVPTFAARLIHWQRQHGRHDLPWQNTRDPYRIWLSEIMLQQTQVASVIPYYQRFLARYADFAALAAAPVEDIMALWSGLGYYARARNLHHCARQIMAQYDGIFPQDPAIIAQLPGIGRSTANAIAAFCFDARVPILDGNVKRVLTRTHGIEGFPGQPAVEKQLWVLAASLLPAAADIACYTQAQMDLGATLCTRSKPDCARCPLAAQCIAHRDGRTTELPARRPRPPLPQRDVTVLLLHDGQRWLFERRPPTGLWGGLLSLPEVATPERLDHAVQQLGHTVMPAAPAAITALPCLQHRFTHFQLTLHPWIIRTRPLPRLAEPSTDQIYHWLTRHELADAALPAPIRRIMITALAQIAGGCQGC